MPILGSIALATTVDRDPSITRARDARCRLPLHVAVASGLPLDGLKMLIQVWPDALRRREGDAFIYPVFLSACSALSTLDETFYLLLAAPDVLHACR